MPSKDDNNCACSDNNNDSGSNECKSRLSQDMESLVQEIKENLRLKARPAYKAKPSRPSPYSLPSRPRSWGDPISHHHHHPQQQQTSANAASAKAEDPYEMLQELLRHGGLIKEAVRRLEVLSNNAPKQRYLYDSDEEARTPLRTCNLDLT